MKIKNGLKNARGITLIALVITIIVLLILAGVTIATLTGENGILTRANDAKTETEQAEEDELRKLTQVEAATYLKEHEYTDVSGEKVTIPAQCAVSQVEGENTLEDGLVIIDKNGNEWVWIEVPRSIYDNEEYYTNGATKPTSSKDYINIEKIMQNYASKYRKSGYILQHGSILYDYNTTLLEKIFGDSGVDNEIISIRRINPVLTKNKIIAILSYGEL